MKKVLAIMFACTMTITLSASTYAKNQTPQNIITVESVTNPVVNLAPVPAQACPACGNALIFTGIDDSWWVITKTTSCTHGYHDASAYHTFEERVTSDLFKCSYDGKKYSLNQTYSSRTVCHAILR